MWPFKKIEPIDSGERFDKEFEKMILRQERLQKLMPREKAVDPYGVAKIAEAMTHMDQFRQQVVNSEREKEDRLLERLESEGGSDEEENPLAGITQLFNTFKPKEALTSTQHLQATTPNIPYETGEAPKTVKEPAGSDEIVHIPLKTIIEKLPGEAKAAIKSGVVSKAQARSFASDLSDEDFEKLWQKLR